MKRNKIKSYLTPELPYIGKIYGYNVFSDGRKFSIDEKLEDSVLEKIIDYMIDEKLIDGEDWFFLT
jgi:hypothetical protein